MMREKGNNKDFSIKKSNGFKATFRAISVIARIATGVSSEKISLPGISFGRGAGFTRGAAAGYRRSRRVRHLLSMMGTTKRVSKGILAPLITGHCLREGRRLTKTG